MLTPAKQTKAKPVPTYKNTKIIDSINNTNAISYHNYLSTIQSSTLCTDIKPKRVKPWGDVLNGLTTITREGRLRQNNTEMKVNSTVQARLPCG